MEGLEKVSLVRSTAFLSCMKKQTYECRRSKSKIQESQAGATTYRKSTPGSAGAAVMKVTYQQGNLVFVPRDGCNMGRPLASEPGRWTGDPACRFGNGTWLNDRCDITDFDRV